MGRTFRTRPCHRSRRPLGPRDAAPAKEALKARFAALLDGPERVQTEAANAAGRLRVRELAVELRELARHTGALPKTRVTRRPPRPGQGPDDQLPALLAALASDEAEAVRSEVLRLQARLLDR